MLKRYFGARRNLLINPKFQLRFVFENLITAMVVVGVFYAANFYFFWEIARNAKAAGLPADHIFFEFIDSQNSLMTNIFFVAAIFLVLLIAIRGILLSHRIAGPLYRLNKHMRQIADGQTKDAVHFRKKDFFAELADSYNDQLNYLLSDRKD